MQMMSGDGLSFPYSIKAVAQEPISNPNTNPVVKKKRNQPGTPDPDAEVIALSPKSLMATNRFVCEICNKGFQRDQNLQLHRRGHNLPWKLRKRTTMEIRRRVYICPEKSCVHHDPSRALGDLTGIKKHFSRKHGEKKWKCEKCSKKYAVQSDWKAHSKTCGTREYRCDCGTLFSRKDSFITHRAFCDALAEESGRLTSVAATSLNFRTDSINETTGNPQSSTMPHGFMSSRGYQDAAGISQFCQVYRPDFAGSDSVEPRLSLWLDQANSNLNPIDVASNSDAYLASSSTALPELVQMASTNLFGSSSMVESLASFYSNNQNQQPNSAYMSATALLQKAAQMGSTRSNPQFVGEGFGMVCSSSNTTISNPNTQNRNHEFHQLFQQVKQPENLDELMNSIETTIPAATAVGDGMMGRLNNLDHLVMLPNGKQGNSVPLKLHSSTNEVENSLTRDFLGVGGDGGRRPSLQQELAKIASMGAAMDLSQYNVNH